MGIIAWIILGLVAGLLANVLIPGKRSQGLILTCLIGIAGGIGRVIALVILRPGGRAGDKQQNGTGDDGVSHGALPNQRKGNDPGAGSLHGSVEPARNLLPKIQAAGHHLNWPGTMRLASRMAPVWASITTRMRMPR